MTRLFAGTPFDIPPQCDDCGKLESECVCSAADKLAAQQRRQREADRLPPNVQTARISTHKRKGGRTATVIQGLTSKANDLNSLLTQLQTGCGTGGTVKPQDDLIELQGDHTAETKRILEQLGYRVQLGPKR